MNRWYEDIPKDGDTVACARAFSFIDAGPLLESGGWLCRPEKVVGPMTFSGCTGEVKSHRALRCGVCGVCGKGETFGMLGLFASGLVPKLSEIMFLLRTSK